MDRRCNGQSLTGLNDERQIILMLAHGIRFDKILLEIGVLMIDLYRSEKRVLYAG